MKLLIFNRRHMRLSILMLVHSYNAIPLPIRKTVSHFAMLKPRNKREYSAIFDELIFLPEPLVAEHLIRLVFRERHDFLICDVEKSEFFKNLDRIRLNGDEEGEGS